MAKAYMIKESTLVDIANAIREKTGSTEKISPKEMDDIIKNIKTGTGEVLDGIYILGERQTKTGNGIIGYNIEEKRIAKESGAIDASGHIINEAVVCDGNAYEAGILVKTNIYNPGEYHSRGILLSSDPVSFSDNVYHEIGILASNAFSTDGILDGNGQWHYDGIMGRDTNEHYNYYKFGIIDRYGIVRSYGTLDSEGNWIETGMITSDGTIHSKGLIDQNGAYHTKGMIDANGVFHSSGKLDAWGGWTSN